MEYVAMAVSDETEKEFWPAIHAGGVLILDNLDTKIKWTADALATASTNGAIKRKKLYTDSDLVTFRARAALCITSASPFFAGDPGLADRLIIVQMGHRTSTLAETVLSSEFTQHRNAYLSHLVFTLKKALGDTKPTQAINLRHPDWCGFALLVARVLGVEPEAIAALQGVELSKSRLCLENDNIGSAILELVDKNPLGLSGVAAFVRERAIEIDPSLSVYSAKSFGRRIRKLWSHLEVELDAKKTLNEDNSLTYSLKRRPPGFPNPEAGYPF
jgi:hypothetical protein